MQVRATGVYRGPHLHSATPMVRIELDLGALKDWATDRLESFTDRSMAELPGWYEPGCCFREPGGFLRRLRQGTWLGHLAEHVALELQSRGHAGDAGPDAIGAGACAARAARRGWATLPPRAARMERSMWTRRWRNLPA